MAVMRLPVLPPLKPMLAKSVPEVPDGEFLYEPKFDRLRRVTKRVHRVVTGTVYACMHLS